MCTDKAFLRNLYHAQTEWIATGIFFYYSQLFLIGYTILLMRSRIGSQSN